MSRLVTNLVDCKTVRIFAYSSTREKSNKRSRTRLKTESETRERRYGRVRLARFACGRLLRHAVPISLLILRKKPTVLQSTNLILGTQGGRACVTSSLPRTRCFSSSRHPQERVRGVWKGKGILGAWEARRIPFPSHAQIPFFRPFQRLPAG